MNNLDQLFSLLAKNGETRYISKLLLKDHSINQLNKYSPPYKQIMKNKKILIIFLLICIYLTKDTPKDERISVGAETSTPFDVKAAHKLFMLYAWTILADIMVLVAFYEYRKYTKIIHSILGVGIIVTTVATSVPSLIKNGISKKHFQHYLMGVILYGIMGLQLFLGIVKFCFIYFNTGNSLTIYALKTIHKYLGYALVIACKVQVFLILKQERTEYSILIGWEIAVGIIFFYRMFVFPKLTSTILPNINVKKRIISLNELGLDKNYIIFGNYVYDSAPLRVGHPAGYKVIEAIQNESADKYLYGMYSSEVETRVPRHSHSEASLKLLEQPVAKIDIPSAYRGFEKDVVKVKAGQINEISKHVYEVRLVKDEGFNFVFMGYSDVAQVGRYHSLTVDGKVTRLYTSVNFLHKKNRDLLKAVYFEPNNIAIDTDNSVLVNESIMEATEENELSLLIKKYEKGAFTKQLLALREKSLQLSSERGLGLSLSGLQPGRVVVVVGGTGIFPFCDLIDLLFKQCLSKRVDVFVASRIAAANPILGKNPFGRLSFEFMGSFHCVEDIPKITLYQILYLCKHSTTFKFLFRIKQKIKDDRITAMGINLIKKRFEELLGQEIMKEGLTKVFVCGPAKMNSSLRKQIAKVLSRSQFQIM